MKRRVFESFWGITVLVVALFIVAIFIFEFIISRRPFRETIECYTEQVETMTLQEAANLFGHPMVELTWFPTGINTVPQVSSHASWTECAISIAYRNSDPNSQSKLIRLDINSVTSIQPTKSVSYCSQRFTASATLDTDCRLEIDGANTTLSVYIDLGADYSREDSIRILEGIKVIEPNELKPNAQTN